MNENEHHPIQKLCLALNVNRGAYYRWLKRTPSNHQTTSEGLLGIICELYAELDGILGYRQMTIMINRDLASNLTIKGYTG